VAFGIDLDVGGLEVAMDDAAVVRVFEGLGQFARDGEGLIERKGALAMRSASVGPSTSSMMRARSSTP